MKREIKTLNLEWMVLRNLCESHWVASYSTTTTTDNTPHGCSSNDTTTVRSLLRAAASSCRERKDVLSSLHGATGARGARRALYVVVVCAASWRAESNPRVCPTPHTFSRSLAPPPRLTVQCQGLTTEADLPACLLRRSRGLALGERQSGR